MDEDYKIGNFINKFIIFLYNCLTQLFNIFYPYVFGVLYILFKWKQFCNISVHRKENCTPVFCSYLTEHQCHLPPTEHQSFWLRYSSPCNPVLILQLDLWVQFQWSILSNERKMRTICVMWKPRYSNRPIN